MNCPICDSNKIISLVTHRQVPILQNAPLSTYNDAINVQKGNINLCICEHCSFVFNSEFQEELVVYTENYNNNQTYSSSFMEHINKIIDSVKSGIMDGNSIVELGCGKGDFLKLLSERIPQGKYYGFDTTYEGEELFSENLTFFKHYFNEEYADLDPNIIITRHVIEHLAKPKEFLISLRNVINVENSKLYFETPDIEWIFDHNAFWDIFYEHCSYFSKQSLSFAFKQAKLQDCLISNVFNGQYLWLQTGNNVDNPLFSDLISKAIRFKYIFNNYINEWRENLKQLNGKVAIWGAGAKGVTFLNVLDPDQKYIQYVIDINYLKQNKFIPGTGHKIVGYDQISDDIEVIIIMNPNYANEIQQLVSKQKVIVL